MQIKTILRILGILLMMFSLSMIPPLLIAHWYHDGLEHPFLFALFFTFGSGLLLWLFFRKHHKELKTRDGFLIVVLFWLVLSFFAATPMMVGAYPHDTFTDAMFESVSGFTTTGATLITDIDGLSHAMRYYRQQLQFLGGMGIIVLAVAILPMLGIGGMQLYRAEMPGPIKESKLTPRITETAKALWYIYTGLTLCCALFYWLAGMTPFDALGESFATVATGGFSVHTDSFAYYHSSTIELIATVFMILGGTNFALHFFAWRHKSLSHYWRDEEFRAFVMVLMIIGFVTFAVLEAYQVYAQASTSLVKSLFNVVSLATTTGFVSAPYPQWPTFIPILITVAAIIGGCAGSTRGGMKVMRMLLLQKQSRREINRLIHPQAVVAIKFGKQVLPNHILQAMWGFIATFVGLFVLLALILMANGLDLTTALGTVTATLANAGASIGQTFGHFNALNTTSKWVLIFAMLAGRLEIFTLLVLLTPAFWRK